MGLNARVLGSRAAAIASLVTVTTCSPDHLDKSAVEGSLRRSIQARLGVEISHLGCPEQNQMIAGSSFDCTIRTRRGAQGVIVVNADDDGSFDWETATPDGFLDMLGVQISLAQGIHEQLGLEVAEVTCPERAEKKAGTGFECAIRTQGGAEIRVSVAQSDSDGAIEWETASSDGILNLEALEEQIRTGIQGQTGLEATIDCGGRFGDTPPGQTLECTATGADGETATVTVTVQDRDGNVDWSLGGSTQ